MKTETQLEFDFNDCSPLKVNCSSDIWLNTSLYIPPTYTVQFYKDGGKIGELNWKDGPMRFEGNAEESAQVFFDEVIKRYTQAQLDLKNYSANNYSGWKS
jgi:hypothetical protein